MAVMHSSGWPLRDGPLSYVGVGMAYDPPKGAGGRGWWPRGLPGNKDTKWLSWIKGRNVAIPDSANYHE